MGNQSIKEEPKEEAKTAEDYFGYEAEHYEAPATAAPQDVQAKVNELVKQVTVDDDGKFVYPEGIDPVLKATVAAEKKFRDIQSGFTKSQMTNKELEAEVAALREQVVQHTKPLELTQDESDRLSDLKYTDPEAWRVEMNKLENEQPTGQRKVEEITQEAKKVIEYEERVNLLTNFNKDREVVLNDEFIATKLPPYIKTKLEKGEVSFEEFLSEVGEYMDKGRTVDNPTDPTLPDLHKETGGSKATKMETEPELDYSQLTL